MIKLNDACILIYQCAFWGCGLEEIDLNNVETLGGVSGGGHDRGAFRKCTQLRKVIGWNLKKISAMSFMECNSLKSIYLNRIESISSEAISKCTSLEYIYCKATTPPAISSDTFKGNNSTWVWYVPDESVEIYKSATNYGNLRIKPISEFAE